MIINEYKICSRVDRNRCLFEARYHPENKFSSQKAPQIYFFICNTFIQCEGELINIKQAWDLEKFIFPDRNQTHDLPNTKRVPYSLSCENSRKAKSLN